MNFFSDNMEWWLFFFFLLPTLILSSSSHCGRQECPKIAIIQWYDWCWWAIGSARLLWPCFWLLSFLRKLRSHRVIRQPKCICENYFHKFYRRAYYPIVSSSSSSSSSSSIFAVPIIYFMRITYYPHRWYTIVSIVECCAWKLPSYCR